MKPGLFPMQVGAGGTISSVQSEDDWYLSDDLLSGYFFRFFVFKGRFLADGHCLKTSGQLKNFWKRFGSNHPHTAPTSDSSQASRAAFPTCCLRNPIFSNAFTPSHCTD